MTKLKSILLIALSGVISCIVSMAGVEYGAIELGALIYMIVPFLTTILLIISFYLIDFFIPDKRKWIIISSFIISILMGIFLRLDFYYNIVNW